MLRHSPFGGDEPRTAGANMYRSIWTSRALAAFSVSALFVAPACSTDDVVFGERGGSGTGEGSGAGDGGPDDAGGSDGVAASTSCGLSADHEVVVALDDTGWTYESSAFGGLTEWQATAAVEQSTGPIAPKDTVSVTVTLDPPLRVDRDTGTLTLEFQPSNRVSELRAVYDPEVSSAGTGSMGAGITGDWALDATGRAQAVTLSGYSLNPNADETLSCFSTRVTFNPIGYDVNDNSAVNTQPGGSVSWSAVVITATELAEVETEPFAFSFGD